MEKLTIEQMELVQGGINQETACGLGIAAAVFFPGPWSFGAAAVLCLTGDTR